MTDENNEIQKSSDERVFIKRGPLRIVSTVFLMLLSVLIIAQILLYFLANPVLKKFVPSVVLKESQGLYTVTFDKISINLTTMSIRLNEFHLIPNKKVYEVLLDEKKIKSALYEIKLNYLDIRGINSYALFYNKKLKINEIRFKEPSVVLIGIPDSINIKEEKKYDAINRDLYPFILKYLNALRIKKINLNDGFFNFSLGQLGKEQSTSLKNISIQLVDFYINNEEYRSKIKKLFYSTGIEIAIKNYHTDLKDSIHVLRAEDVFVSTLKKEISAKKISLKPEQNYYGNLSDVSKNIYNINVPELRISNIDFIKAYFDKEVDFSTLFLPDSKIRFYSNPKTKKAEKDTTKAVDYQNFNLYDLIKGDLSAVRLDTFKLLRSEFQWFYNYSDEKPAYTTSSMTVILDKFDVDSLSNSDTSKILYAENIRLSMHDFRMELTDNIHVLKAEEIKLSTDKSRIYANEVELKPLQNFSGIGTNRTFFDIYVPHMVMSGVSLKKAYNQKELPIYLMHFMKPMVNIVGYKTRNYQTSKQKLNTSSLYGIISNYLKTVNIEKLRLIKGLFNIESYVDSQKIAFTNGRLNLNLYNFALDTASANGPDKLFYADDMEINLQDYNIKLVKSLHVAEIREVNFSTIDTVFVATDILIHPHFYDNYSSQLEYYQKSKILDISIGELKLEKADLHKAYFNKDLRIKEFFVTRPKLRILNYPYLKSALDDSLQTRITIKDVLSDSLKAEIITNSIGSFIKKVKIDTLAVRKGALKYINYKSPQQVSLLADTEFDLQFKNIKFNIDSLLIYPQKDITQNAILILSNNKLQFFNKPYVLNFDQLKYDITNSDLLLQGFKISGNPNTYETNSKTNVILASVPELQLKGFKPQLFLKNNLFKADSFFIRNPEVTYTLISLHDSLKNKSTGSLDKEKKTAFDIKHININKLNISINKKKDLKINHFLSGNTSVMVDDFVYPQASNTGIPLDFSAIKFDIEDFNYYVPDSLHVVRIAYGKYESDKGMVINDFSYSPVINLSGDILYELRLLRKTNFFDIRAPYIRFTGLDIHDYVKNKNLKTDSLIIKAPFVRFESFPGLMSDKHENNNSKGIGAILKKIDLLTINNLSFSEGILKTKKHQEKTDKVFSVDDISGKMKGFSVNEETVNKGLFFNTKDITINLGNYKYDIPKSPYSVFAKWIGLSTSRSEIFADSIKLKPYNSRYEVANHLDFQKGILSVEGKSLKLKGVDIPLLLKKRELRAENTIFDEFAIEIYKNRKLPINYLHRPPYLPDLVKEFDYFFNIDTIMMLNAYVSYEELAPMSSSSGIFTIENLNTIVYNFTNDSLIYKPGFFIKANLNGDLMGKSHVEAFVRFYPGSTDGRFKVAGKVDSTELYIFNPLLENIAFVSIKNGFLNSCRFSFDANRNVAKGDMRMRYNDLKINLLNKDTISDNKGFTSFLANRIIRNDNPAHKFLPLRSGKIYYERNVLKPYFHYWSSSLLSGIKSSMGFNSREIREELKKEREVRKIKEKEFKVNVKSQKKSDKNVRKNIKKSDRKEKRQSKTD